MKRMILSYIGTFAGLAVAAFGIVAFADVRNSDSGVQRCWQSGSLPCFDIPVSYTVFAFNGILFSDMGR